MSANASRDQNRIPTLLGVSSSDGVTPVLIYADPVTHRLYVTATGGGNNFTISEIAAGSGTTFTLANTPVAGTVAVYGLGQRLYPSGVDYTITGSTITTINTWGSGQILVDYQY